MVSTCRFGPLTCHWTMRYEARHKWFRKLSMNLGNFINIPYTLSTRFQQLQCYQQLSTSTCEDIQMGPGETINNSSTIANFAITGAQHIYRYVTLTQNSFTLLAGPFLRARWVKVHGNNLQEALCPSGDM